jgi:hypothetical protein
VLLLGAAIRQRAKAALLWQAAEKAPNRENCCLRGLAIAKFSGVFWDVS